EVHGPELLRLGRARARGAHELHERVRGRDGAGESGGVDGVADTDVAAAGKAPLRALSHERPHAMAAREQARDQPAAQVSRAPGDEDVTRRAVRQASTRGADPRAITRPGRP